MKAAEHFDAWINGSFDCATDRIDGLPTRGRYPLSRELGAFALAVGVWAFSHTCRALNRPDWLRRAAGFPADRPVNWEDGKGLWRFLRKGDRA